MRSPGFQLRLDSGIADQGVRNRKSRDPESGFVECGVRGFKFVRTLVLLIAESGTIDPGIRSPVLLSAESGPGGASPGLGVNLSATICACSGRVLHPRAMPTPTRDTTSLLACTCQVTCDRYCKLIYDSADFQVSQVFCKGSEF